MPRLAGSAESSGVSAAEADPARCDSCGASTRPGWRYCKACGGILPTGPRAGTGTWPTGGAPGVATSRHVLVLLLPDGSESDTTHELRDATTVVGRSTGQVRVPDDSTLSARHAAFEMDGDTCAVSDLDSTNGTFVSVRDRERLRPGDIVLVGSQRLFYRHAEKPKGAFELVQVLRGGRRGKAYLLGREHLVIGRREGELRFPDDRLLSGRHAEIAWDGHGHVVRDLGSRNRTFLLVTGRRDLRDGDRIVLGRQLFEYRILG